MTPRWWTPLGEVEVRREAPDRWTVIFGGFARSTRSDLRAALAEACGERSDAPWLIELEREIVDQARWASMDRPERPPA